VGYNKQPHCIIATICVTLALRFGWSKTYDLNHLQSATSLFTNNVL